MAKILIIDDSKIMRDLLADFLIDAGYDVYSTGDEAEGIFRAQEEHFDLCICDMHLIATDGYSVVKALEERHPDMKFIITDSLPDERSEEVRLTGKYSYIRKPFDLTQIRETLQLALRSVKQS